MRFLVLILALGPAEAAELQVRFIGNSGFEITDGRATLLVDFPYQSGAFGYMTFDRPELEARSNALCLFTHRHADHFDPETVPEIGCSVAGPEEVLAAVDEPLRLEGGPSWRFGGAWMKCLKTEHGGSDHCSWLIHWHDRVVVVSGDVERLEDLAAVLSGVDLLFIPAWLASEAERVRAANPDVEIVISHHKAGEGVPACSGCIVPAQGERIPW